MCCAHTVNIGIQQWQSLILELLIGWDLNEWMVLLHMMSGPPSYKVHSFTILAARPLTTGRCLILSRQIIKADGWYSVSCACSKSIQLDIFIQCWWGKVSGTPWALEPYCVNLDWSNLFFYKWFNRPQLFRVLTIIQWPNQMTRSKCYILLVHPEWQPLREGW